MPRPQPHGFTWRKALGTPAFTGLLAGACVLGVALALVLPHFFAWIERRPGLLLHDPLLAVWGPEGVSKATFSVLYGSLLAVLVAIAPRPLVVLHGLWAYILLLVLRMAAMAWVTLEPPPGIIPLIDPFTQVFYPGGTPFLKDLFFSGHTATLALMALLAPRGWLKWAAWAATAAIGALVLVQHVHWTVDVLAAPLAAWGAWRISGTAVQACVISREAA